MSMERIAVVGAGAVGCYFGGMLARAGGRVAFIGRPGATSPHMEALEREGLLLDSIAFQERIRVQVAPVEAVRDAELVLVCVKTLDTEEAARQVALRLARSAVVVSLQNGVDNVERMRAAAGIDALPAVVYVAAAIPAPGRVKHSGRGDLVMGHTTRTAEVARVAETFTRAGVPCRTSDNIEGELWVKLIMNCAGNAVTALGRASYGRAARHEGAREVIAATAAEAIAVARAAGVKLPAGDFVAAGLKLAETLGEATSSTAQDIARGRHTEIASLNGYIARRGAALGVATPVNHTLFALVKLLEEQ
jgi:2-dehydropantoate 2-reductase